MMKRVFILMGVLLFMGSTLFAQQIRVSGTVTDASDGSTLPGVTIQVAGTSIGTVTDGEGNYEIDAPADGTLVFSFIGMTTREVPVDGRNVINVALEPATEILDEFVVVAYGEQRREASTGAITSVGEDEIRYMPSTSPEKLLQGKVAGMQVQSVSGQPGGASQVRIRGFSSVNAGQEPLYVVDGVPVSSGNYSVFTSTGNALSNLSSADIESITVLKDAAAASIYGSRAANGVILITTKRGTEGEDASFNVKVRSGVSQKANDQDYRFMNADEIYQYNRTAIINSGFDPEEYSSSAGGALYEGFYASETLPDVDTFDWEDAAFRDATFTEYEFNVRGGTDKTQYYTSASYIEQEGIMIETGLERFSFRSNVDQRIGEMLTVGTNINATYSFMDDRPNDAMYFSNPFWASVNLLPWHLPYNEDGSYNFDLPSNANSNFLASAEYEDQWEEQYRLLGTVYGELNPFQGLTIRSSNSAEILNGEGRRWWDPRAGGGEEGTLQVSNTRLERYTTTNTINYRTTFAGMHNVRLMGGQEAFLHNWNYHYASGSNLGIRIPYLSVATDENSGVGYSFTEYSLMSFFSVLDYDYDEKYNFQGSIRRDGNSKFGEENRWATFWSLGGSWNMHREDFLRDIDIVNMLKLRASYGISGNESIGIYDQYGTYGSAVYNGVGGMNPTRIPNPDLTWEENTTFNIGIDFAFLGSLQGSLEYYNRQTDAMLLDMPISRTAGDSSFRINIGEMENRGFEGTLSYEVLFDEVALNLKGNVGRNKVEILDLGGEEEIADGFWRRFRIGGGYADYYVYDWAGVNPANGQSLYYDEDGNLTPNYGEARRVYSGNMEPDVFGGFGFDLYWKGFGLSTFFEFKLGHYIYVMESRYTTSDGFNWGSNQNAALLDHWEEPGDVAPNPKPLVNNQMGANEWGTSRFLEKGDYLRFKDLTLSYNLPRNLIQNVRIDNARIFFNAVNLYTWHDVSYWDPERDVTGGGYIVFPMAKTFSFGVELGF